MDSLETPPDSRGSHPPHRIARTRFGSWVLRAALMVAGLGLLLGFFLPWLHLGTMASMSGFSLMVTGGDAVEAISGPHRALLLLVPMGGAVLCAAAVYAGRVGRVAAWAALLTGAAVTAAGLLAPLLVFLDTTGSGMWTVALSALLALAVGLFSVMHERD
ncbi:MAG: hypothetical protein H6748_07335 [Spirochaetaceae bacterium]|nr:hypothetical protein [Myxococcales bacterium]MCB9723839.1 hypothetical protein [Spirochaetaceae bacterium]HPG26689.1 hypothetical protein [Myxococcota bacterium]